MKSTTLVNAGCGALACMAAAQGVGARPQSGGSIHHRVRPRHPSGGDFTKTVFVTVSYGPSTTVVLESTSAASDACSDEQTASALPTTTSSSPSVIVSTVDVVTEVPTTIFLTSTDSSSIFSSSTTSSSPTSSSEAVSTSSTASAPSPTQPFTPEPDWITAPAVGGGNPVLAKNAADAQELNRKFRGIGRRDKCNDGDEACVGDASAHCAAGTWDIIFCSPNAKCRAVPRMQTNGVVLGCYTDAEVLARISSTGQAGNAFGE